jgi:hypothetical protein
MKWNDGFGRGQDIIGWASMTFIVTWNFIGQDGKIYQEQTDFSIAILAPTASKFILHQTNPLNLKYLLLISSISKECVQVCALYILR